MRRKIEVSIGDRYNRWEIVSEVFIDKGSKHVKAKCDCGTTKVKRLSSLTNPTKPDISCGCLRLESMAKVRKPVELGTIVGRLTVVGELVRKDGRSYVEVSCGCGSPAFEVRLDGIKSGNTKSCGCLQKEVVSELSTTHGMSGTTAYSSWQAMKDRCNNPNNGRWDRYGGRGITFPDHWKDFIAFWEDMQESWYHGADIDRIDFNDNYSKENCRWVDRDVGNHNKSKPEGTSIYKGVYFDKARSKWTARLNRNLEIHLQQRFDTELEAAIAYDNCSEEIYGDRPNNTQRDNIP